METVIATTVTKPVWPRNYVQPLNNLTNMSADILFIFIYLNS